MPDAGGVAHDDDVGTEPSLPLAGHEIAHREHERAYHEHFQNKHHIHHRHHNRDALQVTTPQVTEVTATVSLVAQVDVDPDGSTFTVLTVPTEPTGAAPQAVSVYSTQTSAVPSPASSQVTSRSRTGALPDSTIPQTSSDHPTIRASSTSPSGPSSSQSPGVSVRLNSTSTSVGRLPYASLNGTSLIAFNTSLPTTQTFSSTSLNTFLYTSSPTVLGTTESLTWNPSTTGNLGTLTATSSGIGGFAPSPSSSGSGSNSTPSTVSTSTVVGGVVGSVAGIAMIAVLLLFFVKWRKNRNGALLSLGSGRDGASPDADEGNGDALMQSSQQVVERRSAGFMIPASLASLTGLRRSTPDTEQIVPSGERGFVRISGRKLPSVLQNGGDGYGDNEDQYSPTYGPRSPGIFAGSRNSEGSMSPSHRQSGQTGTPVIRPGPARTPLFEDASPNFAPSHPTPSRSRVQGYPRRAPQRTHTSRFDEAV